MVIKRRMPPHALVAIGVFALIAAGGMFVPSAVLTDRGYSFTVFFSVIAGVETLSGVGIAGVVFYYHRKFERLEAEERELVDGGEDSGRGED